MSWFNRFHFKFVAEMKQNYRIHDPSIVYRKMILEDVKKQIIDFKDFKELRPDIAAGLLICSLKGKVYYKDIGLIEDDKRLPLKFDPNYKLVEIDAKNLNLHYETLFNFTALKYLKKLDLSFNYEMDNFCCDKLASLFYNSETLSDLRLHGNNRISENGLVALAKIKSLRYLSVSKFRDEDGFFNISNLFIELFREQRPDIELKIHEANLMLKMGEGMFGNERTDK